LNKALSARGELPKSDAVKVENKTPPPTADMKKFIGLLRR